LWCVSEVTAAGRSELASKPIEIAQSFVPGLPKYYFTLANKIFSRGSPKY